MTPPLHFDADPPGAVDVAVIVVNYGTADLALAAVDSALARNHGDLSVEVHLVDNASPGDDAARLSHAVQAQERAGRVIFHPETINHGFGRGNNLVLQALASRPCPPRFVFLLNPDARLKTDVIAELTAFLVAHPKAAAVGAGIDLPDGTARVAAFRFPGTISEFSSRLGFGPVSRLLSSWNVPLPPGTGTQTVDWVAGAAVMFRFDALAAERGFDPAFFLYYEEVELMHRLRLRDWQIWHYPSARVEHVEGAATGVDSKFRRETQLPSYWFDSWRYYFLKTRGRGRALSVALAALTGAGLHMILSRLRGRAPAYPPGFPRDFLRGCVIPLIRPGRPT